MFLTAVVMSLFALAVWIELALREAAIYVAVAFLPLTFVAIVWRPTTIWCRRLTEGLVAIILSKFALAVAFTLAAGALGDRRRRRRRALGDRGRRRGAPDRRARAVDPAADDPVHAVGRRPGHQPSAGVGAAASSAPGATMATGAARMLMYGTFTGGAAPLPAGDSVDTGGPPAEPAAATDRGTCPVAVIPDPPSQQRDGRTVMASDERQERVVPLRPARASRHRRQLPPRPGAGDRRQLRARGDPAPRPAGVAGHAHGARHGCAGRRRRPRAGQRAHGRAVAAGRRRHADPPASRRASVPRRQRATASRARWTAPRRRPGSTSERAQGLPGSERAARRRQRARRLPRSAPRRVHGRRRAQGPRRRACCPRPSTSAGSSTGASCSPRPLAAARRIRRLQVIEHTAPADGDAITPVLRRGARRRAPG